MASIEKLNIPTMAGRHGVVHYGHHWASSEQTFNRKAEAERSSRASSHRGHRYLIHSVWRGSRWGTRPHTGSTTRPDLSRPPRAVCGSSASTSTEVGPVEPPMSPRRRAEVGNSAVEDPLTRDGPQGHRVLTDPQHGRQGRTLGPQRREPALISRARPRRSSVLTHAQVETLAKACARRGT